MARGLSIEGRVLTIVAAPPPVKPGQPEYGKDQDIEDVLAALPPDSEGYTRARAYGVESLATVLEEDLEKRGAPRLVQIVGHGEIGILYLGYSWTGENDEESYGMLDSNAFTHNVLANKVKPGTAVWLLGCDVGVSSDVGNPGVADGPTLLFDLCRVWSCAVSAPMVMVQPTQDFEGGVYKHPNRLATASGLCVTLGAPEEKDWTKWNGVGAPRT